MWISRSRRCDETICSRNATNSSLVWRSAVLPMTAPVCGLQGGVERERPVADVLEAVSLGAAGRQRQNGIAAVEGLNRGLFIDAEDGRMLRRIQIQPDDLRRLLLEIGIGRSQVALQSMRLQAGPFPRALDQSCAARPAGRPAAASTSGSCRPSAACASSSRSALPPAASARALSTRDGDRAIRRCRPLHTVLSRSRSSAACSRRARS